MAGRSLAAKEKCWSSLFSLLDWGSNKWKSIWLNQILQRGAQWAAAIKEQSVPSLKRWRFMCVPVSTVNTVHYYCQRYYLIKLWSCSCGDVATEWCHRTKKKRDKCDATKRWVYQTVAEKSAKECPLTLPIWRQSVCLEKGHPNVKWQVHCTFTVAVEVEVDLGSFKLINNWRQTSVLLDTESQCTWLDRSGGHHRDGRSNQRCHTHSHAQICIRCSMTESYCPP